MKGKSSTDQSNKENQAKGKLEGSIAQPAFDKLCTGKPESKRLMNALKTFLIRKTQNTYKQQLTDSQAFRWKYFKQPSNQELSSSNLISIQDVKPNDVQFEHLLATEFPILSFKNQELCLFATKILSNNPFAAEKAEIKQITKLVQEISLNYNIVSYHNFSHAFSLTLLLFQCIERSPFLREFFTNEQIYFSLIAGLAHDLNHPGTNNLYEVKRKTKLAQLYNNESVLENMHVSLLWKITQNKDFDPLKIATDPQRIKKNITQLILATDVAKHFKNLAILSELIKKHSADAKSIMGEGQNRYFIMEQLFHGCDIGNPCLDFMNYMNWSSLLTYEFNSQTLLEIENKLEITEMFRYKDLKTFYQGQVGFINGLVMPLWKEIAQVFPCLTYLNDNIRTNLKELARRISQEEHEITLP